MSLEALIPMVLKTSIFLTVLGLGLRASVHDVVSLARDRSRLVRSMVAALGHMPLVAALRAPTFDQKPAG